MQFLCEFGAVGFGLMLAATLALAWPLLRQFRRQLAPGLALAGVGMLAVLGHSLIDLPFRSPGILYAWLAVAGVSRFALRPSEGQTGAFQFRRGSSGTCTTKVLYTPHGPPWYLALFVTRKTREAHDGGERHGPCR